MPSVILSVPQERHPKVEPSGGNVFADLGLPDPELLAVKAQLASALRRALAVHRRRAREPHARTAARLGLAPAAYDRLRAAVGQDRARSTARAAGEDFSHVPLDAYVRALAALGYTVEVSAAPAPAVGTHAA